MENKFGLSGFIDDDNSNWEKVGEGVKRKIMGFNKDLMMAVVEFKKGSVGYLHKHIHSQVSFIAKGSVEVTINMEKKKLKQGDVFFIEPNIEHGVLALEDSTLVDAFTPYREDFISS